MEIVLITVALLGITALIMPALGLNGTSPSKNNIFGYITTLVLSLSIVAIAYNAFNLDSSSSTDLIGLFRNDLIGSFVAITVLTVSLMVSISSIDYVKEQTNLHIYYSLILFTALGMTILSFAVDLIAIIVAWELMSLPTYVLAGFQKKDPHSNESAVKYFILGAFSSGILLYSISILYGLSGSTNIYMIIGALSQLDSLLNPLILLSAALFIAGFGLKMSLVPFHAWAPDTYEGAPLTIGALLSAGTKKAGFIVALRLFLIAFPLIAIYQSWTVAFAVLAVLTMILGNLAALTQQSTSRLLAYSSIGHAGFIIIGFAVATPFGITGTLYHMFNHAIMQAAAFLAIAAIDRGINQINVDSYAGLWKRMPITAFSLTISLLALAGIPPLNGFWSKLVLIGAALEGGALGEWGIILAITGVLTSVVSLAYYALVIKKMYMDDSDNLTPVSEPKHILFVLIIATIFIIASGLYPAPFYEFAANSAANFPNIFS